MAPRSAAACSIDVSVLRRAIVCMKCAPRCAASCAPICVAPIGSHASIGGVWMGNAKAAGVTPRIVNAAPSIVAVRPTTDSSRPKRSVHSRSEMTAVGAAPGFTSSSENERPRSSGASSVPIRSPVTNVVWSVVALPRPVRIEVPPVYPATRDTVLAAWKSVTSGTDAVPSLSPSTADSIAISRSAPRKGSGVSRTPLTTLKIDVVAPIPMASTATTSSVNAGALAKRRRECFRSVSMGES